MSLRSSITSSIKSSLTNLAATCAPLFTPGFVVAFRPMVAARDAREIIEIDCGDYCVPVSDRVIRMVEGSVNGVMLVADAGRSGIIGYSLFVYYPRSILMCALAIRTDARRQGIGSALYRQVYAKVNGNGSDCRGFNGRKLMYLDSNCHERNASGLVFMEHLTRQAAWGGIKATTSLVAGAERDGSDSVHFRFPRFEPGVGAGKVGQR